MFRILYNSDFEYFYTRDAVFKASDGIWYVTKSLKLSTTDTNFLDITNLRLFGETTKSLATVENAVVSGNKIEVFISNIERYSNQVNMFVLLITITMMFFLMINHSEPRLLVKSVKSKLTHKTEDYYTKQVILLLSTTEPTQTMV